ncbi:MAG: TonB family protein [Candidatus Cloacimonetes bacterium]|nr:TonB family protein [Candidatus Cloacimonadota bacterium]
MKGFNMPKKENLELKLNLIYQNVRLDGVFVEKKHFFIGSNKKVFWQILDSNFPKKHKLVTKIGENKYQINLPSKAKIEKLEKGDIQLSSEKISQFEKNGNFTIDDKFSGSIILNSEYKIEFLFIKRPTFEVTVPKEYENLLKRHISFEEKRAYTIIFSFFIFGLILSIIVNSIDIPEIEIDDIKAIEYAAQVIMPSAPEEKEEPIPQEVPEGVEEKGEQQAPAGEEVTTGDAEPAEESQAVEQVTSHREQVATAQKAFRSQMFATIGGRGTSGGIATGLTIIGGTEEIEEGEEGVADEGGNLASALSGGGLITKRKIAIGKDVNISIAGKGSGQISAEVVEDAAKAEALIKKGGLKSGKVSSLKGSVKARMIRKKSNILDVISNYQGGLKFIHSEFLKKYPNLFGTIYLHFIIDENGNIKNISILKSKSTINNPEFEEKILQKVRSWTFPPIKKGSGNIEFNYPLIFTR